MVASGGSGIKRVVLIVTTPHCQNLTTDWMGQAVLECATCVLCMKCLKGDSSYGAPGLSRLGFSVLQGLQDLALAKGNLAAGSWARRFNIQINVYPNQGAGADETPCKE